MHHARMHDRCRPGILHGEPCVALGVRITSHGSEVLHIETLEWKHCHRLQCRHVDRRSRLLHCKCSRHGRFLHRFQLLRLRRRFGQVCCLLVCTAHWWQLHVADVPPTPQELCCEELSWVPRSLSQHRLHRLGQAHLESVLAQVLLRSFHFAALLLPAGGFLHRLVVARHCNLEAEHTELRVAVDIDLPQAFVCWVHVNAARANAAEDFDLAAATVACLGEAVEA
mmetsp:Transcript_3589/g.11175  ORF Transcript_3589/g.11175 Transcript_3589/m.11175 type:complete len:225 (+) Transcript_3589:995-1669(+)